TALQAGVKGCNPLVAITVKERFYDAVRGERRLQREEDTGETGTPPREGGRTLRRRDSQGNAKRVKIARFERGADRRDGEQGTRGPVRAEVPVAPAPRGGRATEHGQHDGAGAPPLGRPTGAA